MAAKKPPIYKTPNLGIEVIGESKKPDGYAVCYIRPHEFFGSVHVRRSRLVMTDYLNRRLSRTEPRSS